MESIKHYLPTPSAALTAMCDGLEAEHVQVDMSTYGEKRNGVCYGCAATNTIIEAVPWLGLEDLAENGAEGFAYVVPDDYKIEVSRFESSIDDARLGGIKLLFAFYGLDVPVDLVLPTFSMLSNNWKSEIPAARRYAEYLQREGF